MNLAGRADIAPGAGLALSFHSPRRLTTPDVIRYTNAYRTIGVTRPAGRLLWFARVEALVSGAELCPRCCRTSVRRGRSRYGNPGRERAAAPRKARNQGGQDGMPWSRGPRVWGAGRRSAAGGLRRERQLQQQRQRERRLVRRRAEAPRDRDRGRPEPGPQGSGQEGPEHRPRVHDHRHADDDAEVDHPAAELRRRPPVRPPDPAAPSGGRHPAGRHQQDPRLDRRHDAVGASTSPRTCRRRPGFQDPKLVPGSRRC